jgi:dipeptidyl aminopeptidase/acylaminoacyl peptidase
MTRLVNESPGFTMHRVTTPMLLLYGEGSLGPTDGAVLYSALTRLGIPNEFILYDEGHGIDRLAAQLDFTKRLGAWFDYWVRAMPYPDAARQKDYDAWRNARSSPWARTR